MLAGAASLATGAALVVHIVVGVSLAAAVVAADLGIVLAFTIAASRLPALSRSLLLRRAALGAVAGLLATAAYDASRFAFVSVVPVTIWPFEAIRIFGELIAPGADAPLQLATGIGYHLSNGTLFGVAFALLVRRPTLPKALAWAAGLELLMISLYPGWLDIRALDEFAVVSVVGHACYGLTLGVLCRRWLPQPLGTSLRSTAS